MYLASTQQAYSEVGVTAGTAASVAAAAAKAGLSISEAVPVVGSIVAGVVGILALFHVGEGCGQACITSAQTEQIFEAAANNVGSAAKKGFITRAQALDALAWVQQQGDQQMAQLAASDKKATAGQKNMDKSIAGVIQATQSSSAIPTSPTQALDSTALQAIFIQPGASGWYAASVSQGASLALQAIADATNLTAQASTVAAATSTASTSLTSLATAASSLFSGLTSTELMLGAGALVAILFFMNSGGRNAH